MNRLTHTSIRAALLGLVTGVAAVTSALAVAATHPVLHLVRTSPLTVAGSGFRAHETLRVTATAGDRSWRAVVVAGARGGFVASWAAGRWEPCSTPLVVVARGPISGTVSLKMALRECAAP